MYFNQVIKESLLLRKESDAVGPLLELEYWRRQLARFMSIIMHLQTEECFAHIQCLTMVNSKLLKVIKMYILIIMSLN